MKKTLLIILILVSGLTGCSEDRSQKHSKKSIGFWTKEKAKKHIQNRENPATWDKELFENDLSLINETYYLTFTNGVFPVPDYDLIGKGSFKGAGTAVFPGGDGLQWEIAGKTVLSNSFFVKSSVVNEKYLENGEDEIFFELLVLTDFVDTVNYSHTSSEINSRNHPDYIGQGFYRTKNSRVDYMAFLTADRNAYAIVNMRLFDLTLGKTILIAPQKDQSFRSMQIDSPKLSSKTSGNYIKNLIKRKEVVAFFTQEGNI